MFGILGFSNVVYVPFKLAPQIYEAAKLGQPIAEIALIVGIPERRIRTIIRHQRRIAMRKKYSIDSGPELA